MSYEVKRCYGNMSLVVVVAEKEDITLMMTSKLDGLRETPVEMEVSAEQLGLMVHTWKMPLEQSSIILTFHNPNEMDVTCAIALQ